MLAVTFRLNTDKTKIFSRRIANNAHHGALQDGHVGVQDGQHSCCTYSMYASLLRLHGNTRTLSEGMAIHHHIITSDYETDPFLGNLLTQMYGRCGALQEAHCLFAQMHHRDVFAWTFTISAFTHSGQKGEAVHFLDCMQQEAVMPSNFTFVELLSACGKASLYGEGQRLCTRICGSLIKWDVNVDNGLLNFYGKSSHRCALEQIFSDMKEKDVVSWNTMLSAYNQQEKRNEACQVFQGMLQQGFIPNKITLTCLSDASFRVGGLAEIRRTHTYIVGSGLDTDVGMTNTLISTYAKCGSLDFALSLFYEIYEPNVVSWTTLITAYVQLKLFKSAISFFSQMLLEGVLPNIITFISIISACASEKKLSSGMCIHAQVVACGIELDVSIGNALISFYGKYKNLENAKVIFDKMPAHDNISWNSLIAVYAQLGHSKEALTLFRDMCDNGLRPDRVTLVSVLEACAIDSYLDEGKQVHGYMCGRWDDLDSIVCSALVNMYSKCGSLQDSVEVFNKVHDRSVVLWTTMISAYVQHNQRYLSSQAFEQMKLEGTIPDELALCTALSACFGKGGLDQCKRVHACIVDSEENKDSFVGNALLSMYSKCGSIRNAKDAFKKLVKKSVVTWTTMITACAQSHEPKQALRFFEQMQLDGVSPNLLTFASLLDACASVAALVDGKRLHELLLVGGVEPDVILGTALVNLYSKCGTMEDARRVFDRMSKRNLASWNAIITGYCQHGDVINAGHMFQEMQAKGVCPDGITFLSIISSHSHAGLVDEALDHFLSMMSEHGLKPYVEHYNCLLDLFGRAGCLDQVENMLSQLPFEATAHSWMSLLSACRVHLDTERGVWLGKSLSKLENADHALQVLLSNLYAADGRFEEAAMVREV